MSTGLKELQQKLEPAWSVNSPGSRVDHVMVVLPSFSVGESLLSHYADRIPALEHRYLLAMFMLQRIESCEMIFVSTAAPGDEIVEYYTSLVDPDRRDGVRRRFRHVPVTDTSHRSVAAKLLDRPDLIDEIRRLIGDRPAFIEPWNVTDAEVEVAVRLGAPINGTDPALWPLGFKSAGRRLFRDAGVPVPAGREDVRTVDDVLQAIAAIRADRPASPGVVVKLDNSGAGDGNIVIRFEGVAPVGGRGDGLRARLESLPTWFLDELRGGGIVEELIVGERFSSPSVQVDITPSGEVEVLATHEQVLGGDSGQVYTGCRFPADPSYAPELARHGRAVGERLARQGVLGRFALDFAVASSRTGRSDVYALEINLRKGGTTHPYSTLRNLVPGRYDAEQGLWITASDGTLRWYRSTDNLVDEAWLGLAPGSVIDAVADAGVQFDHRTGAGVVLHMLSSLGIDGRFGLTAIGRSPQEAEDLYERAAAAVPGPETVATSKRTSA
jgi:PGM1 C-terminal domain